MAEQRVEYGVWAEFSPDQWDEISKHRTYERAVAAARRHSQHQGRATYVEENFHEQGDPDDDEMFSQTVAAFDAAGREA